MITIVKTTTKGQITLPALWRKKFNTNQFVLSYNNDFIKIKPINLEKILKEENKKRGKIIFNAVRDNKGKGISADNLIKVLKKIDG